MTTAINTRQQRQGLTNAGDLKPLAFDVSISDISTTDGYFGLMVHCDGITYIVNRSESDFLEFDKRIRKKYPRCFTISSAVSLHNLPPQSNEHKISTLSKYLKGIQTFHEILSSDEFLSLLDEEYLPNELFTASSSSSSSSIDQKPTTLHGFLFKNESPESCTVMRNKDVSFEMKLGDIIIWQFWTDSYDIAFSVELNNTTRVEYSRFPSHEKIITGVLESDFQNKCVCKLSWDNSYAKFRSKQLYWLAKVVSNDEYKEANQFAIEIQKKIKKYEKQRSVLKCCIVRKTAKLAGIIQNFSHADEQLTPDRGINNRMNNSGLIITLEKEIERLIIQIENLSDDLSLANISLDEALEGKRLAEESRDEITRSWQYALFDLNKMKQENSKLKQLLKEGRDENGDEFYLSTTTDSVASTTISTHDNDNNSNDYDKINSSSNNNINNNGNDG